jgi:LmbE family N-acetylglucosaminyl deacetylase
MTGILDGAPLPGPDASGDIDVPHVVLAIGAHPDDIEFHCGATLARWAMAGAVVHLVVCTDGSKGTWDPNADTGEIARLRRAESADAAAALGATGEVILLGATDGELATVTSASQDLHDELVGIIRRLKPDVVIGHDPWRRYRLHPDHRAAGWLAVDACVAARDPHFLPHRGAAHRPNWLMLFEADEPNHVERAPDTAMEVKVAALLAHRSQWRSTMFIDDADDGTQHAVFVDSVRQAAAEVGVAARSGSGESFHRMAL